MSKQRPVYLIGMMGAGKSTIGARLAARLGRSFLDTDREVERATGRRIPEIFASEGEDAFRRLEAEAIEATSSGDAVVALGGGAVVAPGAIERILARGDVVFLCAPAETLVERIGEASGRPLLMGLDRAARIARLEALLADRLPFYERANVHVDAQGRMEDVVDRIVEALGAAWAERETAS